MSRRDFVRALACMLMWQSVAPQCSQGAATCKAVDDTSLLQTAATSKTALAPLRTLEKPIYFLHISKAAGTEFCSCARWMGFNQGQDPVLNCHALDEHWPTFMSKTLDPVTGFPVGNRAGGKIPTFGDFHENDCEKLAKLYRDNNLDVEGNENYMPNDGHVCPQFVNVVHIREPLSRLVSYLVMIRGQGDVLSMSLDWIIHTFPLFVNNYAVRALGGYATYTLPFDEVTDEHLTHVKETLNEFDYVFPVDENLTSNWVNQVGWTCDEIPEDYSWQARPPSQAEEKDNLLSTTDIVAEWERRWPAKDWQRLVDLNKFDTELFQSLQARTS